MVPTWSMNAHPHYWCQAALLATCKSCWRPHQHFGHTVLATFTKALHQFCQDPFLYNCVNQLAAGSCAHGALSMARSHEETSSTGDLKESAISSTSMEQWSSVEQSSSVCSLLSCLPPPPAAQWNLGRLYQGAFCNLHFMLDILPLHTGMCTEL
ncbi:hypothetical protein E2C01_041129 [Portunus trituberculatus]|uniref:Uncharacterized protein n=1 Tax=Portunus trituberculatus TaxID=210409 RepID=A0A5B7FPH7_PORTR|nr:hypothetical protein [Portunus trituberculatus]